VLNLLAVFDLADPERTSRLREARIAALLLSGSQHALSRALADAIADPDLLHDALSILDALPAVPSPAGDFGGRAAVTIADQRAADLAPKPMEYPALRDRLLALRDDLRGRLAAADVLDASLLAMLADVETVLTALLQTAAFDRGSLGRKER
jgi:hypothetical protein